MNKSRKNTFIFTLLIILAFLFKDFLPFFYPLKIGKIEGVIELNGIVVSIIIWLTYKYVFKFKIDKNPLEWKNLLLLSLIPIYTIFTNLVSFLELNISDLKIDNISFLVIVFMSLIQAISIGVFEEIIFRLGLVTILSSLIKKNTILLMIVSGIIFSVAHLGNISSMPFWDVMNQLIYSAGIGFTLTSIYLIFGKLWIPIIFHILINWLGFIAVTLGSVGSNGLSISVIIEFFVSLIISILVLKKYERK